MSTGPDNYCLDLSSSMAAVHPWFHASLPKPGESEPAGLHALEDDSHKIEAILQSNKC